MSKDSSMKVRYTAARALGRMGTTEAIPELRKRLLKENNIESIFWFQIALARLEDPIKGPAILKLKNMKKRKLLTEKQVEVLENLEKMLKQKAKKIKKS
jgi:hypothetical protein